MVDIVFRFTLCLVLGTAAVASYPVEVGAVAELADARDSDERTRSPDAYKYTSDYFTEQNATAATPRI